MTAIPIQLIGPLGEPMGTLRIGADTLIAKAEETARSRNLTKRTALPLVLREYLAGAGYAVGERELSAAVEALEKIRRGEILPCGSDSNPPPG